MWGRTKEIFQKAWADTLDFFGWSPRQLIWPILFLAGWVVHGQWAPSSEAPGEELMLWATYTLAPIGAFGLLLFQWNFLCAPYRIEKSKNADLLAENAKLHARTPAVRMRLEQCLWGGRNIDAAPDQGVVCILLFLANTGDRPIAVARWLMHVEIDGSIHECMLTHHSGKITLSTVHGPIISYGSSEFIYEKMQKPLAQGEYVRGILIGYLPIEVISVTTHLVVHLSLEDIYGVVHKYSHDVHPEIGEPLYFPGVEMGRGFSGEGPQPKPSQGSDDQKQP
jgi:hypothetical protein